MIPLGGDQLMLRYSAGIIACLTVIGYGCIVSWTSPSLPHLMSENSQFPVTENQGSWIASVVNIGMIIGYISNALIIDKLGRKKALLLLSIPQTAACISIILAQNWLILCLSRITIGIGYGGGLCAATAYLAEIGDQNTRGIFLVMIKLSLNIGIFFVMLLGAYLPYNKMNIVLFFLPVIFILSFSLMPDSHYFSEKKEEKAPCPEDEQGLRTRLKNLLTVQKNRRAFLIVTLLFLTEAVSGHAVVMAYTQEIFNYSGSTFPPEHSTLVLTGVKIIASLLSTLIIERVDRKIFFLFCGILATVFQTIVGLFFLMKYNLGINVSSVSWIPLLGITMYEVVENAGFGGMAYVYTGELFSPDVKGVGITLTCVVYDATAFLIKLQFHVALNAVGISGIFFTFAITCVMGTAIVFYLVPETRGKSLEEIQRIMGLEKKEKNFSTGKVFFLLNSKKYIVN